MPIAKRSLAPICVPKQELGHEGETTAGNARPTLYPGEEPWKSSYSGVKEAIEFWVEEMESICAYDTAKACGGEIIPFEQAVSEIERDSSRYLR